MAADQNISKFQFNVVSSVNCDCLFQLLVSFCIQQRMSSFAWTKAAVFTITGGLYRFVIGNGYWIFTMTATASEESLEKFVLAARMWIILSSGTMKLIHRLEPQKSVVARRKLILD